MAMSCSELIDEIQARCGRPDTTDLIDTTWLTRRINEAQKIIIEEVPLIPSVTFHNRDSIDTTGTTKYAINEISVGDSTTANFPCNITDVWYLDGNESKKLVFKPVDEYDRLYPDPTHSDANREKPVHWTLRDNGYIEIAPLCASGYWDNDLKITGDFYAADFTTDSTSLSDISRADEGLILYGVWKSWQAIGSANPSVVSEIRNAKKMWSNPYPATGETLGWLESFGDKINSMVQWNDNFYED